MVAPLTRKNTIEQTGLQLSLGGFSYAGRQYTDTDVVAIRSYSVIHQTHHVLIGTRPTFRRATNPRPLGECPCVAKGLAEGDQARSAHQQHALADQAPPVRRYRGASSLRGGDRL
jgi:hypothetical protein